MKKLSDFKDDKGIVIAAQVLAIIMDIFSDQKNLEQRNENNPVKMFSAFMANSPAKMQEMFAVLSECDPADYHCDGAEALTNMLLLANDPVLISLFTSQSQMRDATSSGSVSENTEE